MKKFGFATIAASGLAAAVLGLAAPAQAVVTAEAPSAVVASAEISRGIDHHTWLDDIRPHVKVPRVDTIVQQSR